MCYACYSAAVVSAYFIDAYIYWVIHRSNGSGTTLLVDYLNELDDAGLALQEHQFLWQPFCVGVSRIPV